MSHVGKEQKGASGSCLLTRCQRCHTPIPISKYYQWRSVRMKAWGGGSLFFLPRSCFPDSSGFPAPNQRLITAGSLGTELKAATVLSQLKFYVAMPLSPSQMPEGNNREDKVIWLCGKIADCICSL